MDKLIAERRALAEMAAGTYGPSAFPRSKAWRRAAQYELRAFDAAHPEVIATIQGEQHTAVTGAAGIEGSQS